MEWEGVGVERGGDVYNVQNTQYINFISYFNDYYFCTS